MPLKTKVIRIGNSRGIVLPRRVMRALGLEKGDEAVLNFDPESQVLSVHFPRTKQLKLTAT